MPREERVASSWLRYQEWRCIISRPVVCRAAASYSWSLWISWMLLSATTYKNHISVVGCPVIDRQSTGRQTFNSTEVYSLPSRRNSIYIEYNAFSIQCALLRAPSFRTTPSNMYSIIGIIQIWRIASMAMVEALVDGGLSLNYLKSRISGLVDGLTLPRHTTNASDNKTSSMRGLQATHSWLRPMAVARKVQAPLIDLICFLSSSLPLSDIWGRCVRAHANNTLIALPWLQKVQNCYRCCLS